MEEHSTASDAADRLYRALCTCGAEVPFDLDSTELTCPNCQARIAVKYMGHHDQTRAIVENAGLQFIKGIFSFAFWTNWTAGRQRKKFEDFQSFANGVFSNHLCPEAKTLDANKRVPFVFYLFNKHRMALGPYDITTKDGFAEYLFQCVSIQTPEFIFHPVPFGPHDCPAVFEVAVEGSPAYHVLHFVTDLMPTNKAGKVTVVSPGRLRLELCFRLRVNVAAREGPQWLLVDGRLLPVKTFDDASVRYQIGVKGPSQDMTKIREVLGEGVASALGPLFASKSKFYDQPEVQRVIWCFQTEVEAELRSLGLLEVRDRLFEILATRKAKNCFVVTACMGDDNHPHVVVMRRFRDEVLSRSLGGRWFIWLYAISGPHLARLIDRSPALRKVVTLLVVRPAAYLAVRRGAR